MALTTEQEAQIRERLMTVYDPELGIDIINLGLVYGIDMDDEGNVLITMTLTSPGCPIGP
ncbi:MAG: iron-sulfur cluster assembly protein, partial [bacterium]|nr:iron-sulfur cluster assembly protein [bacterium]